MSHNNSHDIIRLRRGTAAEWSEANELLKLGEPGFEKDTYKLKIGDGVTLWNDLGYVTPDFINIVSSGDIADLTLTQQNQIVEGTIVLTNDGIRWIYTGTGSKIEEASYVQLADISPSWIQITSKPASLVGLADIASTSIGDFILATGNNTYQVANFAESVDDRVGQLLVAGTGVSLSYNDSGNSLSVNITDAPKILTSVFNKTGSPIAKFSVVYINGGQGDQPTITLAQANIEATSSKTYGITAENIANMSAGKVVVFGSLTGINTDQFNPTAPTGDVNGTTLYLSPSTPGGVTTTKPSAPNHMVAVGTIVRTHQNEGVVEVRIQNGYELEELHNVAVSGVTNGQFLQYNSASGLWVPTSSGNFSTLQLNGTGVSVSGHNHTSSNISDFTESVQDVVGASGFLVGASGISISYNDSGNTLTITGAGGATITNAADNRVLTSDGTSTGINGENNLTFDGSLLNVTGSGTFVSGISVGGAAVTGVITGLSTTSTVPSIRFQSITANHTNTSHVIFDWYKNLSTRLFYIDGAGNFYADASNGNFIGSNTAPASNNGAYIGHGMRRHSSTNGFDFTWGESITSTTEPGMDLFPIGGTHIASGILFRLSKNSTKTDVAMIVNGSGNVGVGTTSPLARLQVSSTSSSINTPIAVIHSSGTQCPLTFRVGSTDQSYVKSDNGGNLAFGANGAVVFEAGGFGSSYEKMKIQTDGKVGIGTNSPAYTLDVNGGAQFNQLYPTVSSLGTTSGAVATDVSTGQVFDLTVNGSTTLSNPTNPVDGVTVRWRIIQGGTGSNSVSLDTNFQIPSSASSPLPWSTSVGAMDILAATYHAGRDKWDVVAFVPGY